MDILKKPIMTEKVAGLQEEGVYGFVVDKRANKIQIKKAVEAMYGVQVDSVRTIIMPGKPKNRYTKSGVISGKTSAYKKAMVKLVDGEFIDLYEERA